MNKFLLIFLILCGCGRGKFIDTCNYTRVWYINHMPNRDIDVRSSHDEPFHKLDFEKAKKNCLLKNQCLRNFSEDNDRTTNYECSASDTWDPNDKETL